MRATASSASRDRIRAEIRAQPPAAATIPTWLLAAVLAAARGRWLAGHRQLTQARQPELEVEGQARLEVSAAARRVPAGGRGGQEVGVVGVQAAAHRRQRHRSWPAAPRPARPWRPRTSRCRAAQRRQRRRPPTAASGCGRPAGTTRSAAASATRPYAVRLWCDTPRCRGRGSPRRCAASRPGGRPGSPIALTASPSATPEKPHVVPVPRLPGPCATTVDVGAAARAGRRAVRCGRCAASRSPPNAWPAVTVPARAVGAGRRGCGRTRPAARRRRSSRTPPARPGGRRGRRPGSPAAPSAGRPSRPACRRGRSAAASTARCGDASSSTPSTIGCSGV